MNRQALRNAIGTGTLKMMLHAIGYHPDDVRRGRYPYYRNYYDTAPGQNRYEWEHLADKGYARRDGNTGIFFLTVKGLDFLEDVLGIEIHNKYVTEYEALNVFIEAALDVSDFESVVNVVYAAKALRISRHRAKKLIDSLRREGLLELHCVNTSWDGEDVNPPYWGYAITEKAKETEQYKERAKKYKHSLDALLEGARQIIQSPAAKAALQAYEEVAGK